jgi:hypothetical protein
MIANRSQSAVRTNRNASPKASGAARKISMSFAVGKASVRKRMWVSNGRKRIFKVTTEMGMAEWTPQRRAS